MDVESLHEMFGEQAQGIAIRHDAVESGCETNVNDEIKRWTLICFVDPAKIHLNSTLEQAHKPVRWRNVGRIVTPINSRHSFLAV